MSRSSRPTAARGCKPDGSPEIRTILFPVDQRHDVRRLGRDRAAAAPAPIPIRSKICSSRKNSRRCATIPRRCAKKARSTSSPPTWCSAWALPRSRSAWRAPRWMPPIDLARGKTPQGLKAMRENNAVQGLIGRTEANLRAARAYLYATADEVWRDLPRPATLTERAPHRAAPRLDLDHSSGGGGGRHRLSHGRRHRGVQPPTSSSGAFATCTPSRSRSRPATPITRMSARRSLAAGPARHRRRRDEAGTDAASRPCRTVILRTDDLSCC